MEISEAGRSSIFVELSAQPYSTLFTFHVNRSAAKHAGSSEPVPGPLIGWIGWISALNSTVCWFQYFLAVFVGFLYGSLVVIASTK